MATHFKGPLIVAEGDTTYTGSLAADNLKLDGNTLSATSGAINITPAAGSAIVLDTSVSIDGGAVDVTGDLDVDNLNLNGNSIISTDTNGAINLTPNGTGATVITKPTLGASGSAIVKLTHGTVSVTVAALAAGDEADVDVTVTGVAAGDLVIVHPTDAAAETGLMYNAWVATTNTVTIRMTNMNAAAALSGSTANWSYMWLDVA